MPFSVKAYHADHPLTVTKKTSQGSVCKSGRVACRRKVRRRDYQRRSKKLSIAEFSLAMALQEIANTVETAAELGLKAKAK
jgi:hypothetical protein